MSSIVPLDRTCTSATVTMNRLMLSTADASSDCVLSAFMAPDRRTPMRLVRTGWTSELLDGVDGGCEGIEEVKRR